MGKIYKVTNYDEFDKWFNETEMMYGCFNNDEVRYETNGVYINDESFEGSKTLNRNILKCLED